MTGFVQLLGAGSDAWAGALWDSSLTGAVVLALAWVVTRRCGLLSPRVNCWIWRLVCVKLLVALCWTEAIPLPLLEAQPDVDRRLTSAVVAAPPLVTGSEAAEPCSAEAVCSPQPAVTDSGDMWTGLLFLGWALGVAGCVTGTARQWITVRRLCRSSSPVSDRRLLEAYRQAAAALEISRPPELRQSPLTRSPLLAGILRPVVIMPEGGGVAFEEGEQRLMLTHELSHYLRRDLIWNWLPTAVGWLFFFHPLVWLMRRCWFESQEAACDELLLRRRMTRPSEYGRLLLKVASQGPRPLWLGSAAAGVLGGYRNLELRILAMNRVKPISRRRLRWTAGILLLSGLAGVVPWELVARAAEPDQAAAPVAQPAAARIYVSTDQGRSWEPSDGGFPRDATVNDFTTFRGLVFAGTDADGVFVSRDGGRNWKSFSRGLTDLKVNATVATPDAVLLGTRRGGVFVSTDAGETWRARNDGLTNKEIYRLNVHERSVFASTNRGLFVSENDGDSWRHLTGDGQMKGVTVLDGRLYAADVQGVLLSTDGGRSWERILDGATPFKLSNDGTSVFAMLYDLGVKRTDDSGRTWVSAQAGLPADLGEYTFDIVPMGDVLVAGQWPGVFVSQDRGSRWQRVTAGLPAGDHAIKDLASVDGRAILGASGLIPRD